MKPTLRTLFYTPTERVALVLARKGEVLTETRSEIMINGVVLRTQQKGMVWVNKFKFPEGSPIPASITPTITQAGIKLDKKDIKVGESIDLDSGKSVDLIPANSIRIKR